MNDVETAMGFRADRPRVEGSFVGRIRDAVSNHQAATCVQLAEAWLEEHPDDEVVAGDYAETLYELTRYGKAIKVCRDWMDRLQDRWSWCNRLGQLHQYRGHMTEAQSWFHQAIDENDEACWSYLQLGETHALEGDLETSERILRRALLCPHVFADAAYYNLGLVLRGQGRLEESLECLEERLKSTATTHKP